MGEGHLSWGQRSLPSEGEPQRSPGIWGSLFMPTPFNAERSRSAGGGACFLWSSTLPISQGAGPSTLRTTKTDVMRRGFVFMESATPPPQGEAKASAPQFWSSTLFMLKPFDADQIRRGNTYEEVRVSEVNHATAYYTLRGRQFLVCIRHYSVWFDIYTHTESIDRYYRLHCASARLHCASVTGSHYLTC